VNAISVWSILWSIVLFIGFLFWDWLKIFAAPAKNLEMLWIIIPIYLVWIFAEFFQEKKGTGFGNAISNGVIVLWVGIDWIRFLVRNIGPEGLTFGWGLTFKFAISLITFAYGLIIIVEGIRTKKFIKFLGRIREVTYVLLMFSPVIYGIIALTWRNGLAMIAFFPLFYYLIEYLDRVIPDPKTYKDSGEEKDVLKEGSFKPSGPGFSQQQEPGFQGDGNQRNQGGFL